MAIRALIHLGVQDRGVLLTPADLAQRTYASVSYMKKVAQFLVRAGILTSLRGTKGGVRLVRDAKSITLLEILEACQGRTIPQYCHGPGKKAQVCSFHNVMLELHEKQLEILRSVTLERFIAKPFPSNTYVDKENCRMMGVDVNAV